MLYVLDEPSIGLHQRDNDRLLGTLTRLRDLGNTVIVVEHDEDAIRSADFVVDIGPGAGIHGGQIIASGTAENIMDVSESITGQYLSGIKQVIIPTQRKKIDKNRVLSIVEASGNNLQSVTVDIPLGMLVCVSGVSGSGKSTLVLETLWKTLARDLHKAREIPSSCKKIDGIHHLDKVVDIDQSPIGRTPQLLIQVHSHLYVNGLLDCQKQK